MIGVVAAELFFGNGAHSRGTAAVLLARFHWSVFASDSATVAGVHSQGGPEEVGIDKNPSPLQVSGSYSTEFTRKSPRHFLPRNPTSRSETGRPTRVHHLLSWERSFTVPSQDGNMGQILQIPEDTGSTRLEMERCNSVADHKRQAGVAEVLDFAKPAGVGSEHLSSRISRPQSTANEAVKSYRKIEMSLPKQKRSVLYNDLISKLCVERQIFRALDLLEEMQNQKLLITLQTFNPILKSLCLAFLLAEALELLAAMRRMGITPRLREYNTVIMACAKAGNMEKAFAVIVELQKHGNQPNRDTYDLIIYGFCRQKRFGLAKSVLREMVQAKFTPTSLTYYYLFCACTAMQNFNEAIKLVKEMRDQGLKPHSMYYRNLGVSWVDSGNIEMAVELMKQMDINASRSGLSPRDQIICYLARAGHPMEADKVYKEELASGKCPTQATVEALVVAYGKYGNLHRMLNIFEESILPVWIEKTQHRGISNFGTVSFTHLVLCFSRHGKYWDAARFMKKILGLGIKYDGVLIDKVFLHMASSGAGASVGLDLLKSMRAEGIRPSRIALEALLDSCNSVESSQIALGIVHEMDKENLPLNIFSKIRVFHIFLRAQNEQESQMVLDKISTNDLKDQVVQFLLLRVLQLARGDMSKEIRAILMHAHNRLAACK